MGHAMKKLVVVFAFLALGCGGAAAFGPSPSDAHPPGALFYSRPGNFPAYGPGGPYGMTQAPVGMYRHGRAYVPVR